MLKTVSGSLGISKPLPAHLSIDVIRNLDGLYKVRKEWIALENRTRDPLTYFQSFDWSEKWCRIFAPEALMRGGSIHIVLIRNRGTLAAVMPLAIENRKGIALVLRFLGEPMIQYAKVLMDNTLLTKVELRLCLERVTRNAKCDAVYLDHLVHGSPLHECLAPGECYQSSQHYASAISIGKYKSGEEYRASLSRQSRKSRNRKRRKLEEMGQLAFHAVDGHDPSFSKLCEIALRQKRLWLEQAGLPVSRLEDDRMLGMLGELGVDTGKHSGAVAFSLSLDNEPIALEIGFWRHDHYYSYLGSYDLEMAEYSPGKLLMEDAIGWSIENGFNCYDLMGNPTPYKEALADMRIPLVAFAHGNTLLGDIYARLWRPRVKPSIKQTLASLPVSLRQTVFSSAARFIKH